MRIAHSLAKLALWLVAKGAYLARPLYFVGSIVKYPFRLLGIWVLFPVLITLYDWYLKVKRALHRIIPPQHKLLFFLTRRAMIHGMMILITLSALTNNIFAQEALVGEERNAEATRILFTILPPPYEEDVPTVPADELWYDQLSQDDINELIEEELPPLEGGGDNDVANAPSFITPQLPPTRREIMVYEVA